QLHYVIFPKSPLADAIGYLYNTTGGIFVRTDGLLEVYVAESYNLYGYSYIDYFLDSNFRVTDVKGEDRFVEFWQSLAKENKLPPLEGWIGYEGKLFNNVMYWTDSGWVTEGQFRDAGL
ncbi:MAG: hypothetical protein IIA17_11520, partial [candidate division Zixibacteria bacterium]|nr:hypothetical protein [candidate division Zixibacteria bacterium]